jgi:hypothetical protein
MKSSHSPSGQSRAGHRRSCRTCQAHGTAWRARGRGAITNTVTITVLLIIRRDGKR